MFIRAGAPLMLLLLTACSRSEQRLMVDAGAPATVAAQAPAEVAAVDAAPPPAKFSFAVFTSEPTLDQCADVTVEFLVGPGKPVDEMAKHFGEGMRGATRIGRPCTSQFEANAELARCTYKFSPKIATDAGQLDEANIAVVTHYYDLDTLSKSDSFMKECLDSPGDWKAVDHDSEAYRTAQRASAERQLAKLQKKYGR